MFFPKYRPRRLRRDEIVRRMVRETRLSVNDFIYPLFVVPGSTVRQPVASMPGVFQLSIDELVEEATEVRDLGIPSILLFGIPEAKDEIGSGAYAQDGIVQQAVRELKEKVSDLLVVTDVCMCEYTSHGHCGVIKDGDVDNDATLDLLAQTALSHAEAGAE
ncbi:MAG: porphobilinogen synthase, partial [Deltaproteobacteria bacterium]|nr:porphobilinogen synthase [Deltaproteobacteria bacterium]